LPGKVIVVGAGFSGLSAACFMAKAGWQVTVVEKHELPGGRGRKFEAAGFNFDMGPSWYWMPDVFERFFNQFGKKASDYYELVRLDPSYRVYWQEGYSDIPADYEQLKKFFESEEPGSAKKLDAYLADAEYKYEKGINKLVYYPGVSLSEYLDVDLLKGLFRLNLTGNMKKHVARYFKSRKLQQLMEFPVLFLGAMAKDTPALYSLMNYADIRLGTWFPKGGMYQVAESMYRLAVELGVDFQFSTTVTAIESENRKAKNIVTNKGVFTADAVIASADYHHTETDLLAVENRNYTEKYWQKRFMAPSSLLYYIGVSKKLKGVPHHSLFFDAGFEQHAADIYEQKQWPDDPLFYVSRVTATDHTLAPPGCDNLFFLIPVAAGIDGDNEQLREHYLEILLKRFEKNTGENIREHIIYKRSFGVRDFETAYNAFKGNAYGLANTLRQTGYLKPRCINKKLDNLYYTGQLTVPGPGVPPSLISGEIVAKLVQKRNAKQV
jgi:phytoene desaturase